MDSYSKDDVHLKGKQQALNLRKDGLLTMEESHDQSQAHFSVDEPLDVQLRFDLGTLVDTHGLLDTQEPRDSHWDFVRHDQGSDREATLLEHVKQNDNCGSWPASSSQMDAQLFIDPQDDINEITDAFATKGKNGNNLVENESCSLTCSYEQHVDATSWVDGKQSQKMGEKVIDDNSVIEDCTYSQLHAIETVEGAKYSVIESANEQKSSVEDITVDICDKEARLNQSKEEKVIEKESRDTSTNEGENINEREATSLVHEREESPIVNASETQMESRSESHVLISSSKGPDGQEDPQIIVDKEADAVILLEKATLACGVLHNNDESTATADNASLDANLGPVIELQNVSDSDQKDETLKEISQAMAESIIQQDSSATKVTSNIETVTDSSVEHVTVSSQSNALSETHIFIRDEQVGETDKALDLHEKLTMADIDRDVGRETQVVGFSDSSMEDASQKTDSYDINCSMKIDSENPVTYSNSNHAKRAEDLMPTMHDGDSNKGSVLGMHPVITDSDLINKEGSKCSAPMNDDAFPTTTSKVLNSHSELMEGNKIILESQRQPAMVSGDKGQDAKISIFIKDVVSAALHNCEKEEEVGKLNGQTTGCLLPTLLEDKTVGIGASENVSVGTYATSKDSSCTSECMGSKNMSEVIVEEPIDSTRNKVVLIVESLSVTDKQDDRECCNATTRTETSNGFTTNSKIQLDIAPGGDQDEVHTNHLMHSTAQVEAITLFRAEKPRNQEESEENRIQQCEDVQALAQAERISVGQSSSNDQKVLPNEQVTPTNKPVKQSDPKEQSSELPNMIRASTTTDVMLSSHVLASTAVSDVISSEVKVSRRKSDKNSRNDKPKDSVQTNLTQIGLDKEPKSTKKGGVGRQNGSPSKSGSKNVASQRRRKGTPSANFQDSSSPIQGTDGFQSTPNANKVGSSLGSRQHQHHCLPDLNVAEAMGSTQPFNEQQQVQLRAQILVYGSLIQGAAPEEALMIAAFSVIPGVSREARSDLDVSGRMVWEKTWQAAVERIEKKISGGTPKSASHSAGVLTAFPFSSARVTDASKVNCSPLLETRNASFLNSTTSEVHDKSSNKSGKSGVNPNSNSPLAVHAISSLLGETQVNQSRSSKIQSAVLPMPSTTIAMHPAASPLGGTLLTQPGKPHNDLPQAISRTYFPTPLSHFLPGSSQWVPSPFSGPWASQPQTTVYNSPSVMLTHPQSLVNSNQSLENRKLVSLPSLSIPIDPILTTVSTTISGSSSLAADSGHRKETKPESRPRKRKKTDSEQPDSPLNVVSSSCTYFGTTQNPSQVSLASTNPLTFSEPLAMVVAETHASSNSVRSLMAPPGDNILVQHKFHPPLTSEVVPGKTLSFQDSINNLEQAKLHAEEATSVADSSVRESASLWSELKSQKSSGVISEVEMQLASSMIAATTAASVAKAAAAAARAAYEASKYAKMIGENALSSSKPENKLQHIGHGQDSSANVSISEAWRMPANCNSIISSAKLASEKKLEAASIAIMNAHNLALVVKAAELAANAVSQVGAIMGMGESVPFTLDTLLEVGPEGVEKLLLLGPSHGGETPSLKVPGIESSENNKEVSERKECNSGTINQSNLQMEIEAATVLIQDDLKRRGTESLEQVVNDSDHNAENRIVENSLVEVLHGEKAIRKVWFSAKVRKVEGQRILVVYDKLMSEDGINQLEDWVDQEDTISNVPKVRLAHSGTNIGFAGRRKRRREAMCNYKYSVGDHVDAFFHDGWCEGEVKEVVEDGDIKIKVHFPGESDTYLIKASMLRPSMVWRNGQWVMWTDIKRQESHFLPVANEKTQKDDSPTPKRQKLEKADVKSGSVSKQTLDANMIDECIRADTTSSRMQGGEITTLASVDNRSSESLSKVIVGVPRFTKRRKFIEVSKQYVSNKSSRVFLGVKENKDLSIVPLQFHIGSAEPSKQDAKSRKALYSTQKTRQHKGQDAAAKTQLKSMSQADKSTANGRLKHKEELVSRFKKQEERLMETGKQHEIIVNKESSIRAIITANTNETLTSSMQGRSKQYPSRVAIQHSSVNEKQDSHMSTMRGRETRSQSTYEIAKDVRVKSRQNENQIVKSDGGSFQSKENPVNSYKEGDTNQSIRRKNDLHDKNKESLKHPNTTKDTNVLKDVGKSGPEISELRRTSRKIQPTSKLLEGLQTAPNLGKSGLLHEKGSKKGSTSTTKGLS